VHVKSNPKGSVFEIRDNGVGFSVADAKREPAGLGLLLMEHYAEQAPVEIEIRSTPGKGTVVRSTYQPAPNGIAREKETTW
jgi:signal transduction histidine kinase